jgi:hypothetical protein
MATMVLFLVPVALIVWWVSRSWLPIVRLPVNAVFVGMVGVYLLARFGVPPTLQRDISRSLPVRVHRLLQRQLAWD